MSRKQVVRKVFNAIYRVISTSVIILGVVLGILYLCGIRLYHVKSGSMGELLPVGCVCFVSTYTPYDSIKVNDVISFRVSDDMLVTHRAVEITKEGITTQGDINEGPDPDPVTKENYIGKTMFAVPYVGYFLAWLHTKKGMITLSITVLAILIMGYFYRNEENSEELPQDNISGEE